LTVLQKKPAQKNLIGDKIQLFDCMKLVAENTLETTAKAEKPVA